MDESEVSIERVKENIPCHVFCEAESSEGLLDRQLLSVLLLAVNLTHLHQQVGSLCTLLPLGSETALLFCPPHVYPA